MEKENVTKLKIGNMVTWCDETFEIIQINGKHAEVLDNDGTVDRFFKLDFKGELAKKKDLPDFHFSKQFKKKQKQE